MALPQGHAGPGRRRAPPSLNHSCVRCEWPRGGLTAPRGVPSFPGAWAPQRSPTVRPAAPPTGADTQMQIDSQQPPAPAAWGAGAACHLRSRAPGASGPRTWGGREPFPGAAVTIPLPESGRHVWPGLSGSSRELSPASLEGPANTRLWCAVRCRDLVPAGHRTVGKPHRPRA